MVGKNSFTLDPQTVDPESGFGYNWQNIKHQKHPYRKIENQVRENFFFFENLLTVK